MIRVFVAVLVAVALSAGSAHAQRARQQLNFSAALGVNAPIGDLDKVAHTGFGVAVRTESSGSEVPWTLRGGLSFDRFGGKGGTSGTSGTSVDNYQFLTFVTELVHHTNAKAYQFAGVGFYQAKTVVQTACGNLSGLGNCTQAQSESDFGFQGGVGLNFGKGTKTFLEIGVVDVLTTGRSSVWFPVRFGIRL